MVKLISLLRRTDGISKDEFRTWVLEDHIELARKLPGLRDYTVNIVEAEDAPYDCVNEMWFDDDEARAAAFASEAGKAAGADAAAHASERVHLVTTEHRQL